MCHEIIIALMLTVATYGTLHSTFFKDMDRITEMVYEDSMNFNKSGYIEGSGWHSGSIDKNFHIAQHNDRLYVLSKTEMSYEEFREFTATHETCEGLQSIDQLLAEGEDHKVDRASLRRLLSYYTADSIRYTDVSQYKSERFRDHQRHYFAHKAVKDFMILTGRMKWSKQDIERLFKTHSLINYMNDLYLNAMDRFLELRDSYNATEVLPDPMLVRSAQYESVFRGVNDS